MLKFYQCNICGNLVEVIEDSGAVPVCCDESMEELIPGKSDGAKEKHIPVLFEHETTASSGQNASSVRRITIQVGDAPHPMTPEHAILWIIVLTDQGIYRKSLTSSQKPEADFLLSEEETVKAIYSYCNLHGLWVNFQQ